jgi:hypothetical protein
MFSMNNNYHGLFSVRCLVALFGRAKRVGPNNDAVQIPQNDER